MWVIINILGKCMGIEMSEMKLESNEAIRALYQEQRSKFRKVSELAETYFKQEFSLRLPDGDYRGFLMECEQLTPQQIEQRLVELNYGSIDFKAIERDKLNNMIMNVEISRNEMPDESISEDDDGVMIYEPWMQQEALETDKVEDISNSTTRSFKDSLNEIKESSEQTLNIENEPPRNKI